MTTVSRTPTSQNTDALSLARLVEMTGGELLPLGARETSSVSTTALGEQTHLTGAAPPAEALPGDITMVDHIQHVSAINDCLADVLITPVALAASSLEGRVPDWQIVVSDPHTAFTLILLHFRPPLGQDVPGTGVDSTANVHPSAQISGAASVGAGVTIGPDCKIHAGVTIAAGCTIGAECVLYPNVTLYSYCSLGDRVVIHAGSTIGAHGFGYRNVGGKHVPTAQLGYVRIDNDVEIGAAVTIDRGTYGATRIGEGTKIDNQVMIAHNCRIGKHNLLCSQVGVAGSCSTGDYCVLAGQVGLKDHIHLGDGVIIGAQAGVMENLSKGVYFGSPATDQQDQLRIMAVQRKLPELRREIRKLQTEMKQLLQSTRRESDGDSASDAKQSGSSKAA